MATQIKQMESSLINGIDQAEAGAHAAIDTTAKQARTLTHSGSRWADRTTQRVQRKARNLNSAARKQSAKIQRTAREGVQTARTELKSAAIRTDREVTHRPWMAVAIVSGVAMLVGALLGRKLR